MATTFDGARFTLLDGEKVLMDGTPMPAAQTAWMLAPIPIFLISVVLIPFIPVAMWAAHKQFTWHRWWVTNRRIVVQNGIIGHEVRSIPLYRVTDVSVTCTWFDKLFGLKHVNVRDMTGEVTGNNGISTGVYLAAAPDAELVRDRILAEVDKAGSGKTEDSQLGRVVELLEQMVAKAA